MAQKNSKPRGRWHTTKLAIAVPNYFLTDYVWTKAKFCDKKRVVDFEGVMDHRNRCNQILH